MTKDEWILCVRKLKPGDKVENTYPARQTIFGRMIVRANCPGCQGYADLLIEDSKQSGTMRVGQCELPLYRGRIVRIVEVNDGCTDKKAKVH